MLQRGPEVLEGAIVLTYRVVRHAGIEQRDGLTIAVREFDLTTRSFVDGGFTLPTSKQTADWLDDDTLIVARDWGPGTMTASQFCKSCDSCHKNVTACLATC